ncbi:MAG: peptide chain release factor N(5)-glutamine methyltransferase [Chloroflexi bacterium]|nr:peptide chain release factor N(5)-glutamine methyltransferase [Chloroflexota bacterium]
MILKQALEKGRAALIAHNIEDAFLEGELLLRHTLNINRVQLYQDIEQQLSPEQEKIFQRLIERRLTGEPVAYIIKRREFYGLDFYVDRRVLIPRPETELLVEKALSLAQKKTISTIVDIGTGCGAIAVSLALNLPRTKIYATDVSASALEVALINCRKHGVAGRVRLLHGDLLDPLPEPVDLIIANLPYVNEKELTPKSPLKFEPGLALNGGSDGLERIRRLCRQINRKLNIEGSLLLEVGQGQAAAVSTLLHSLFPSAEIEVTPDLGGIDRVVSFTLTRNSLENQRIYLTHKRL